MTEMDRMRIVENMFPDWKEHLSDGKIIDHILEGLACRKSYSTDARDEVVIMSHDVAEKGAKTERRDGAVHAHLQTPKDDECERTDEDKH